MPARTSYLVLLVASDGSAPVRYVGPFSDVQAATRYSERIRTASNGTVRTEVAPMSAP